MRYAAPAGASAQRWVVPLIAFMCLAVGILVSISPPVGAAVGLLLGGCGIAFAIPGSAARAYTIGLVILLIGYAFLGRGFAYLGIPPVFVGEAVLAVGVFALLLNNRRFVSFRTPITWLLIAVMLWGAATTFPYLPVYGIDSLRDGVLWGYAIAALAIVPILVRDRLIERVPGLYARVVPIFILWAPIAVIVGNFFQDSLPLVPGTEVPIIDVKAGDMNVHLAGAATFLLLGLKDMNPRSRRVAEVNGISLATAALWGVWLAGFVVSAAINRGGMLAVFTAIGIVLILRPAAVSRRFLMLGVVGFTITSVLLLSNLEIRISDRRPLSIEQLTQNVESIFTEASEGGGTAGWRLQWWGLIVDYTVFGPYRWTGKGYGINLADADGFQVNEDSSLRSPHNGHLTVLARSGVPGFALWVMLHLGFTAMMLRTHARSRAGGDEYMARISLWILAYYAAFMINGTFDVYLEGPQGGIWMWTVFGMGVAASLVARDKERERTEVGLPVASRDPIRPEPAVEPTLTYR